MKQLAILSLAVLTLSSSNGFCTLGEKFQGVDAASKQKKMVQQTSDYSVHESVVNGTTIKEYTLADGTVFAVTWRGLKHPELGGVLGNYKTEYDNVKDRQPKQTGRAPLDVTSSKLSVRMSGHMRDVHGAAYDPNLMPAGFSVQDLK